MKTLGIIGSSPEARLVLCRALLPELTGRGLRVSVLVSVADDFDLDKPGKDSFEHRFAGANEVMISSERRWALMHENRAAPDDSRVEVLARMAPVDLLLLAGSAPEAEAAIALCDVEDSLAPAAQANIVALIGAGAVAGSDLPCFQPDDAAAIAAFIVEHCALCETATERELL